MRRLKPPDHVHIDGAYTNISNTCEQCMSSQAHVLGFAVSYHNYHTHKSYYTKTAGTRKKRIYLGWLEDCEIRCGRPTEWNQRYTLSATDSPDKVKSHLRIRKEKEAAAIEAARAAREALPSTPSEEPEWPASPLYEEPEGASSSSGFCLDSSLFA